MLLSLSSIIFDTDCSIDTITYLFGLYPPAFDIVVYCVTEMWLDAITINLDVFYVM